MEGALLHGIAQAQGNRSCGRITVAVDVHYYLGIVDPQALLRRSNDAQVGLMGHEKFQVVLGKAILFEQTRRHFGHTPYGVLKYLRSFLVDIVHTLLDGFLAGGIERPATWHVEERSAGTID